MGRAPPPSIPTGKTNLQKTRAGIAPARHKKTPAQRPGFPTSNHTRPTPVNSTRKFPVRQSNRQSSIGNRLSAIVYRQSSIGYRLLAIGYRLLAIVYRQSSIANRLSPIVYRQSWSHPPSQNPNGVPSQSPGLRPSATLGPPPQKAPSTLKGLHHFRSNAARICSNCPIKFVMNPRHRNPPAD